MGWRSISIAKIWIDWIDWIGLSIGLDWIGNPDFDTVFTSKNLSSFRYIGFDFFFHPYSKFSNFLLKNISLSIFRIICLFKFDYFWVSHFSLKLRESEALSI